LGTRCRLRRSPIRRLIFLCALLLVGPLQAGEKSIDKDVVVNATLEQAWDAWTTREGLVSFFAPDAQVEPRVGGAFHLHFDPGAPAGAKGADPGGMRRA